VNIAISVRTLSVSGIVDGAWIRRSLGILELALVWRSTALCFKCRRMDPRGAMAIHGRECLRPAAPA